MELPIFGKGSQPPEEDGSVLEYLSMPQEMSTFSIPVTTATEFTPELQAAHQLLQQLLSILAGFAGEGQGQSLSLLYLDATNKRFINEFLGEGEVSIRVASDQTVRIQESVLAGVWRIQTLDEQGQLLQDRLEVGLMPQLIQQNSFLDAGSQIDTACDELPVGVMNAPSLFTELNAHIATCSDASDPHVINLSLLPQTEQDLAWLAQCLGAGQVTILSRGYGNCRISSTATKNVWWVQYFNSEDTMILNTLEVCRVPNVACAALEDIVDSHERLQEMLQSYYPTN